MQHINSDISIHGKTWKINDKESTLLNTLEAEFGSLASKWIGFRF